MGNCISNKGLFEPPGADSLAAFVNTYDTTVQDERQAARRAAARVPVDDAVGRIPAGEQRSDTRGNVSRATAIEQLAPPQQVTVTHMSPQILAVAAQSPTLAPSPPPSHEGTSGCNPQQPSQSVPPANTIPPAHSASRGSIPLTINTRVNTTAQLTHDQMELVQSLWNAKVPAPEIAQMMEYMKSASHTNGQGSMDVDMKGDIKSAESATTISQAPDSLFTPTTAVDTPSLPIYSKPTSPIEIYDASGSDFSPSISSTVQNRTIPDKQQPIILAPPVSGPSVALLNGSTSTNTAHEPSEPMGLAAVAIENDTTNGQLTDQQIDFVADLSMADVASTDVARVMERMRSKRRATLGALPPSYDEL